MFSFSSVQLNLLLLHLLFSLKEKKNKKKTSESANSCPSVVTSLPFVRVKETLSEIASNRKQEQVVFRARSYLFFFFFDFSNSTCKKSAQALKLFCLRGVTVVMIVVIMLGLRTQGLVAIKCIFPCSLSLFFKIFFVFVVLTPSFLFRLC